MKAPPMISVVIPTYNRSRRIARVLPSYLSQRGVREVIVVDDGSKDDTPRVLAGLADQAPALRTIRLARRSGAPTARQAGIEVSQGDLIFLGEDDVLLEPGHLETLAAHMEREQAHIIAGRRIWVHPDETVEDASRRASAKSLDRHPYFNRRSFELDTELTGSADVGAPVLQACMLVRREVFEQVAYDPGFRGNAWREETDFQMSAAERGFKLVFCPHTLSWHLPRYGKGGQHLGNRLWYEHWVLRNHHRFLRKHLPFLKERFHLRGEIWFLTISYMGYRGVQLVAQTHNRMKRAAAAKRHSGE